MDRIQSLKYSRIQSLKAFSAFTKFNSKKITICSTQLLENKYCISANKCPRHLLNFETFEVRRLKEGGASFKVREIIDQFFFIFVYLFQVNFILVMVTLLSDF